MKLSIPYENRYCSGCQCTTRHEIKDVALSCLRCGAEKFPSKFKEALRISTVAAFPKANCA